MNRKVAIALTRRVLASLATAGYPKPGKYYKYRDGWIYLLEQRKNGNWKALKIDPTERKAKTAKLISVYKKDMEGSFYKEIDAPPDDVKEWFEDSPNFKKF